MTPLLVATLFLSGCDTFGSNPVTDPDPPRALTQEETQIVEADNAFGLNVFTSLNASAPEENLFISPLSISMALGMTLNGAAGDTRAQMEDVLQKKGLTEAAINDSYRSLIDLLTQLDPKVTLNIANSIWYREGFNVLPAFLETNRTSFDAEVEALDFNDSKSLDTINGWVDDKTNGLIDKIIDEISPEAVMYLINAVYFKGTWTYEFDPAHTQDADFHNADGSTTTTPLMSLRGTLPYYKNNEISLVDLPYGDSLYSMTLLLPEGEQSLDAIIENMTTTSWADWTSAATLREIDLFLPKFELAYKTSLKNTLALLGMQDAFSPASADFTRINDNGGLFISDVLHKTFVTVDEQGTEAAAVTAVVVETTSVGPPPPVFRADRPFIFAIRERHSGSILFIGKVLEL